MTYLLLPGRHIVNTKYQETYLSEILNHDISARSEIIGKPLAGKITELIFAVTSCNKSNSRYNPLPFEIRAILVYEFCRVLQDRHDIRFRIIGIPHYLPTPRFSATILKEIAEQTDGNASLTPGNTVVFSSTPAIIKAYRGLGFSILPGEYDLEAGKYREVVPNDLVQMIGNGNGGVEDMPLSTSTHCVFRQMPDAVERITRLFHDPILTEQGDLTETRNYSTYAHAMANVIEIKYDEIRDFILPGKIVDEGCADGALIERIVRDFPDSDIIGIDLSAEMLARAGEAKRIGVFGAAFVFFKQQNLMTPVSDTQARTVDTIICNSTLHELWSYGAKEQSVRNYLQGKFKQLRTGGRLVIRDVVGPENGDRKVILRCATDDGVLDESPMAENITDLCTYSRFLRYIVDFTRSNVTYGVQARDARSVDLLIALRDAMEFITKMNYTDNWSSEMHEEFCFWSFKDWTNEITRIGFSLLPGSHAYTNQWRVEHSFQKRTQLFELDMAAMDFPVTNMVLAGEKPARFSMS